MTSSENKKIKNATPLDYNGVHFRSTIEVTIYKALVEAGLSPSYETKTFVLMEGFKPSTPFYIRDKRSKELELNTKKIIDWKYTPDIIVEYNGWTYYIEVKGMQNDVYRYKRKMFLKLLESKDKVMFFEIYSKKEILKAIEIIKNNEKLI